MSEQMPSVGALLKSAREKSGRGQEDATRELNLSRSQLLALESDQFDALPGEPFVRGYIRLYAKWLALDVDAVIAQYLDQTKQKAAIQPTTKKVASPSQPRQDNLRLQAAGVVVAMLVLCAWLYHDITSDDVTPAAPVGQVNELQVDSVAPQRDVDSAVEAAAALVQGDASDDAVAGSGEDVAESAADAVVANAVAAVDNAAADKLATDAAEAAIVATPESAVVLAAAQGTERDAVGGLSIQEIEQEAIKVQQRADEALLAEAVATRQVETVDAASEGQDALTLTFTADCWVEVRDASQKTLYAGLGKAGRVRQLAGQAPFDVLLGFARGASLQLNGEPFAFTPRANRNSMRLTVGNE